MGQGGNLLEILSKAFGIPSSPGFDDNFFLVLGEGSYIRKYIFSYFFLDIIFVVW